MSREQMQLAGIDESELEACQAEWEQMCGELADHFDALPVAEAIAAAEAALNCTIDY